MRIPPTTLAILTLACIAGSVADGADPLHVDIDRMIEAKAAGPVAKLADDAEFLRRVTLDLAGRVPTFKEATDFHADSTADKRAKLIDRLLASADFPRRMQEWFEVMVLERRAESSIKTEDWSKWLQTGFRDNTPWNQLVAKLLFVEKDDAANQPATKFLKATGRGGNSHQVPVRKLLGVFEGALDVGGQEVDPGRAPHPLEIEKRDLFVARVKGGSPMR